MAGKHEVDIKTGEMSQRSPGRLGIRMEPIREKLRPRTTMNQTVGHQRIAGAKRAMPLEEVRGMTCRVTGGGDNPRPPRKIELLTISNRLNIPEPIATMRPGAEHLGKKDHRARFPKRKIEGTHLRPGRAVHHIGGFVFVSLDRDSTLRGERSKTDVIGMAMRDQDGLNLIEREVDDGEALLEKGQLAADTCIDDRCTPPFDD